MQAKGNWFFAGWQRRTQNPSFYRCYELIQCARYKNCCSQYASRIPFEPFDLRQPDTLPAQYSYHQHEDIVRCFRSKFMHPKPRTDTCVLLFPNVVFFIAFSLQNNDWKVTIILYSEK